MNYNRGAPYWNKHRNQYPDQIPRNRSYKGQHFNHHSGGDFANRKESFAPRERFRNAEWQDKPSSFVSNGIRGRNTELCCNFIKLELLDPGRCVHEYQVTFEPEVDDRKMRAKLVNKHFHSLTERTVKVYNFGSILWSPFNTEKEVSSGTYDFNEQKVSVTFIRKYQRMISECKIILNVIIKRIMSESQFVRIKRSDYRPTQKHIIPEHKLEIWPGIVSAVEDYDGGVLLNLDTSFKVLQSGTVYDILTQLLNAGCDASTFKERAQKYLLGMSVMTTYNNQVIKIDDIDFNATPRSTFKRGDDEITYLKYYKEQYSLQIRDLNQPMLVSRVKRKPMGKETEEVLLYFVPELCHPTGLSENQRSNFRLMKDVARVTQLSPEKRNEELMTFLKNVNENENCRKLLTDWGLKVPEHCMELKGRTLDPEVISFGRNRTVQEPSADWGRALSNAPVLKPVRLEEWAILFTYRDERVANTFCVRAVETCRRLGIEATAPKYKIRVDSDRPEDYCRRIRSLDENAKMIVIIFPTRRDDRYVAIKKLCNELGIPSQVINSRTLQNPQKLDGVMLKVIMQMNCKMGGALWGVTIPNEEEGVMICGLESYHESGRLRPGSSAIALVTSVNKSSTQWTSNAVLVPPGQTTYDCLQELFRPNVERWFEENGDYPKRIIVYRVGVGDGQLGTVRDLEIPQLKNLFRQAHAEYCPALTFIVVQTRINTKFYEKRMNGYIDNPPPGTVLDHTVTKRNLTDFYLVSPNTRMGTVSPTHYIVLENTSDMQLDSIELMTYKMTHLYYNWNSSIRVPAPCQYAQKLAYQVGQRILPPTTERMRNCLHFL